MWEQAVLLELLQGKKKLNYNGDICSEKPMQIALI